MWSPLRAALLVVLLTIPLAIYMGLGAYWLWQAGYLLPVSIVSVIAFTAFALLARRWTRSENESVLPPIDWSKPATHTPRDREAWAMVERENRRSADLDVEDLGKPDTYIDAGRRLFENLSRHYYPDAKEPLDQVPLLQLLTALELAAEDLHELASKVPGVNFVTLARSKMAVKAANVISRASDYYTYILPLFNPAAGLARLGVSKGITKPAMQAIQANLMRWLYQAYINRLGTHLIALYSGRLAVGATRYRELSERLKHEGPQQTSVLRDPNLEIRVAVMGPDVRRDWSDQFVSGFRRARSLDPVDLRDRLDGLGVDPSLAEGLTRIRVESLESYPCKIGDPLTRGQRQRLSGPIDASKAFDMLVILVDLQASNVNPIVALGRLWDERVGSDPGRVPPPVLVLDVDADASSHNGRDGNELEAQVRENVHRLAESDLPLGFVTPLTSSLNPSILAQTVLPAIVSRLPQAEQAALHRQLHPDSQPSVFDQVAHAAAEGGLALLQQINPFRRGQDKSKPD